LQIDTTRYVGRSSKQTKSNDIALPTIRGVSESSSSSHRMNPPEKLESEDIHLDTFVYCFGDGSRGQLGSGDENDRARPQENFWVTKLLRKLGIQLKEVSA
jgi:alpha-tubulin suppressor-like RCC1 family protein